MVACHERKCPTKFSTNKRANYQLWKIVQKWSSDKILKIMVSSPDGLRRLFVKDPPPPKKKKTCPRPCVVLCVYIS